jgi:hypothetical protein
MTSALVPGLRPGSSPALTNLWRDEDIHLSAGHVCRSLFGPADILPLTVFAGARCFPVVSWNAPVVLDRSRHNLGTFESPTAAAEAISQGVPSALSIIAAIGVGAPGRVRSELAGVRALARTVAMVPTGTRWRGLLLQDYDAQGTAVVQSNGSSTDVLVGGDAGPKEGTTMSAIWRRVFEEQLVAWSIRSRELPSL